MDLSDIYKKLDKMNDSMTLMSNCIARMDVYTEQNTKNLEHHITRTDLLEDKVNLLRIKVVGQRKIVLGATGLLGSIATIMGIVWVWSKISELS